MRFLGAPSMCAALLLQLLLLVADYCSALALTPGPLVISSDRFAKLHAPMQGYHPECPARVEHILARLRSDECTVKTRIVEPRDDQERALAAIGAVHDATYIKQVRHRSLGGAPQLQPWDSDTYMSKTTWEAVLLAQNAWLDAVEAVASPFGLEPRVPMAFAVARPPGHHAEILSGQGFCIFNFAAAAAVWAVKQGLAKTVSILDIDVHYGNGVSDICAARPSIRYASLHQDGIYPLPPRPDGLLPSEHGNIYTVSLPGQFGRDAYLQRLSAEALPFLRAHPDGPPELLIVCAGYDALASDELASGGLKTDDYRAISEQIKEAFAGVPTVFGLEGGYNLRDLPLALEASLRPFAAE